jgi:tetratricopeptide (TPR) repeat protein
MIFAEAGRAMETGDYSTAWFWLQRLCRAEPRSIEAARLVARFEEAQRSPEELPWRVRVIQIGPATLEDYLDWASAALRLGQSGIALEALDHVPGNWQDSANYHGMLGTALAADGQLQAADENFAEAARIDPTNVAYVIDLSSLRLNSADKEAQQTARATLESLAGSPATALPALRGLLGDALRQRDAGRIARFRVAMIRQKGLTLEDTLSCIAAAPTGAERHAELGKLWSSIEGEPPLALQVAEWMIRGGDAAEALAWLRTAPDQADTGIEMGEADGLAATRDWARLRAFITGKNWGNCDYLRVALTVRCGRETGVGTPLWTEAVTACHGDGSELLMLAQCAAGWGWETEVEALYWQVAQSGYPARGPALKGLWTMYSTAGNTAGLLRVAHERYNDAPGDIVARNNFAFLSMLTGIGRGEADRIARDDYGKQPENANVAATYAYSLYLNGRYDDGLRVLRRFGQRRLQEAGAELYLAVLQKATGDEGGAMQTAAEIDATKLLPEERALLQKIGSKAPG